MIKDRTEHVKHHLTNAISILQEACLLAERDIGYITDIEKASVEIQKITTQLGFSFANSLSSIVSASRWVEENRQMEILDLKEQLKDQK